MGTYNISNFEWDEAKRQANLAKHGIDFAMASIVFANRVLAAEDRRRDYGERRYCGLGLLQDRVVFVVFTLQGDDTCRVISLRRANRREQNAYESRASAY